MEPDKPLSAERRLIAAISQKRRDAERLFSDIERMERELSALRRFGAERDEAPRSSSTMRLLVEHLVLDRLRANVPPEQSADQLWPLVHGVGVASRSTFRSHLRRMKERGLIVSLGPGQWGLAPGVTQERRMTPNLQKALDQITRPRRKLSI